LVYLPVWLHALQNKEFDNQLVSLLGSDEFFGYLVFGHKIVMGLHLGCSWLFICSPSPEILTLLNPSNLAMLLPPLLLSLGIGGWSGTKYPL